MGAFRARLGVLLLLALSPAQAFGAPPAPWEEPAPLMCRPQLRPIVIDAGHGGEDFGAVAARRYEKDIALAVARKLRDRLRALDLGPVRMTRDSDSFVSLNGRVEETAAWDGAFFISLHANKARRRGARGVMVYAFGRGHGRGSRHHRRCRKVPPLPAPPAEQAKAGARLAADLVRGLRGEGFRVEAPARAEYYVLKNPGTPSVLVELGFMSHPEESKLLADPAYQDRLAAALAESLSKHLAMERAPGPAAGELSMVSPDSVGR